MLDTSDSKHVLRPIVNGWLAKIELCAQHRKDWENVATECRKFYGSDFNWFWDGKGGEGKKDPFIKEVRPQPTFRLQLNKAFEFVALFGPMLYNRNPNRTATPRKSVSIPPELFIPQFPPAQNPVEYQQQQLAYQQYQMQYQQILQQQGVKDAESGVRAELMATWLNYTPNEQPHGGLKGHAERAVTDALVCGRGVLWQELYTRPGSNLKLTGSFYDDPFNLYIDPDAERWDDVMWVARKCTEPIWKVERDYASYGLQPGALRDRGTFESITSQAEGSGRDPTDDHRRNGQTSDLITYYKIWSRMGVGARLKDSAKHDDPDATDLMSAFDKVAGDYCYIVVVNGLPYPLNLPTEMLLGSVDQPIDDGKVAAAVQWPVPYWKDSRWPCSVLDFYSRPRSTLPTAPLEPGIGELKFLNVMISHLSNRIWSSSRDFIAVKKALADYVKTNIREGKDLTFLELDEVTGSIRDNVEFLQQPQTNLDVWRIIEAVMQIFDKRVGLSDLLYALNPGGTQPRSAAEMQVKQQSTQIRPDYMSAKVEEWLTEGARLEALNTRWNITGPDVAKVVGEIGSQLWQTYVLSADVDAVVGEMEYRLESGTARKRDKQQEATNAQQVIQTIGAQLFNVAQMGNPAPYNAMLDMFGDANDIDVSKLHIPPMAPPQPQPQ